MAIHMYMATVTRMTKQRFTEDSRIVAQALEYERTHPEAEPPTLVAQTTLRKKAMQGIMKCMAKAHKTRIKIVLPHQVLKEDGNGTA
ncbi:hypothetical protein H1O16_gp134 [Burkholderia phage BcepSaruman]|uniref:Uncharacterized protein n=1 Tax=Burkholderia phage BcepSaruman TaxID=2530032 RepID=A0A4D5ZE58_9CAUD|nr:hypothetical protein H1O16_gp134 [Burkholderia phage BcepSaruman]QBX06547.1 hypothetical protein BcepSaruman_134 [Burkholderia phage BcepSaruman]